jgi:aminoglycoside phosphotransferase (APT) family kinase protein
MAMHNDELHIDEQVARRLITDEFPEWRLECVRRLATDGTVNAIFRIGADLTARFPLRSADPTHTRAELAREAAAMRELAAYCPVPTPSPVAMGDPGHGYPLPWTVQTWIHGAVATPQDSAHSEMFAQDLVDLVRSLRVADTKGRHFGGSGRGGNLHDSDAWMEVCFRESDGLLPVNRLRALWAELRSLPKVASDVMTHGDLIPGNLLVEDDRLIGVLDGGGFAPADPSLDLVAAWHMLDDERRSVLRSELACGDVEWRRGAAWAFQQAMGRVWYYRETNPGMSTLGQTTLARILNDPELSALTSASPCSVLSLDRGVLGAVAFSSASTREAVRRCGYWFRGTVRASPSPALPEPGPTP